LVIGASRVPLPPAKMIPFIIRLTFGELDPALGLEVERARETPFEICH